MRSARFITLVFVLSILRMHGVSLSESPDLGLFCSKNEAVYKQGKEDFSIFLGKSVTDVPLPLANALNCLYTKTEFLDAVVR